jgi:hypothetical protein
MDYNDMLLDLLRRVKVPDVEFVVEVLDKPSALKPDPFPLFHHVKTDAHSEILIPHPWHYRDLVNLDEAEHENRDLSKRNTDFDTWEYPWEGKDKRMVWRGSANGGDMQVRPNANHHSTAALPLLYRRSGAGAACRCVLQP